MLIFADADEQLWQQMDCLNCIPSMLLPLWQHYESNALLEHNTSQIVDWGGICIPMTVVAASLRGILVTVVAPSLKE